jgi:polyisoprenoid-binding protein YceI
MSTLSSSRSIRTRRWLLAAAAAVILVIVGFIGVYFAFFNSSAPPPLALSSGSAGHSTSKTATSSGGMTGTWSIVSSSVVGYRVREKLAFLPAKSDAVGRTHSVAGSMSLAGSGTRLRVTAATFVANVRTLKSDRAMRDARIHTLGLQSDQYPTVTFVLIRPISIASATAHGQVVHTDAVGSLTLHGVTRTVTIPLTARFRAGQIETVGSITFPFSQFGMQPPNIGGFVSVENHATMEFDLRFQHSASAREAAAVRTMAALKPITGGSSSPGSGPAGGGVPGGAGPTMSKATAVCLSKHGVSLPKPGANGAPPSGSSRPGAQNSKKMATALKACGVKAPTGPAGGPPPTAVTPTP